MRWTLGVLASVLLATASMAQPQGVAPPSGRAISFAKFASRIPSGTPWATIQAPDPPFSCASRQTATWDSAAEAIFKDPETERIFRTALTEAGLNVSGDQDNLFEQDTKSADLQVGALLTGLKATFCLKRSFKDALADRDRFFVVGSADLEIEWQVYSTLEGRVVGRFPTKGSFATKTPIGEFPPGIVRLAFAAAARNLAADPGFRQIVSGPVPASARQPRTALPMKLPTKGPASPAEASVAVAVVFAGGGMGSGFLISPEGYLLTNKHVVGDAERVRIRWYDKTESVGEVVRSDPRRDVALIKVAPGPGAALVIRTGQLSAGDTVFAIGTPLEKDFQNTVTRGVVSGQRTLEGLTFVQSDVAVDHGNSGGPLVDERGQVVAITQSAYAPDGISHNINFFIPIADALAALNLQTAP